MPQNLSEQQPEHSLEAGKSQPDKGAREPEYRRSETFLSIYANSTQIRTTPWDIQLIFGEIFSADEQKLVIENQLAVTLSPQQAKALVTTLSGQVQNYERRFGEIRYTLIESQTEEPSA